MDSALLAATLVFIIPMCFSPGPNNVLCAAHGSQHGHHYRGNDAFTVLVPPPFEGLEILLILHMICHACLLLSGALCCREIAGQK